MAATMHPAAEAAITRTARGLAERLDSEWEARQAAASRLDALRAELGETPAEPEALLDVVRRTQAVLAEVAGRLAPEAVRHA